jgi:hypothetical protein
MRINAFLWVYYAFNVMSNSELEIQNAVQHLMERYGDETLKEVDLRILELESRNQPEALSLWLEIRKRVELLLHPSPGDTRH